MGNIRKQIEKGYADLRRSEKLAADYVLEHMNKIWVLPIDRRAPNAGATHPTVLRMLRSAGFPGYRDFCYRLVAELAKKAEAGEGGKGPMYGYTLDKSTPLKEIPFNMAATTQKMLEETVKNFSGKIYQKTVEALANARLIDIYGVENSEATALDLLTKLLYLGLPCRYFSDCYHQQIAAGALTPGDVAVGISYSGESKDTVDSLRTAKKAGARTIAVTNFKDAAISRYADILICTSQEQLMYGDAIFSRSCQILVVDMIYMGIISLDYDRFTDRLKRCEKVVREKAYGGNAPGKD